MTGIEFRMKPPLTEAELAPLLEEEWGEGAARGYGRALERSLTRVGAFQDGTLVGFVNVAWDGNLHAFIVDAIVRENLRGRGIGLELVRHAIAAAREAGVRWVHADYEPHLDSFWAKAGFLPTRARVLHLGSSGQSG